jgi:phage tail sheath gpL-like
VSLPVAIDPLTRRPGVGLKIDLKTGSSSSAAQAIRILLLSPKNASGGTATVDTTVYESVVHADAVSTLLGPGSLGHLAASRVFEEFPTAAVDVIALAAASGAQASGTITFDDTTPVTVARVAEVEIAGRVLTIDWFAGETDITAATRLVAKIGQLTKELPVTATNGGGTLAAVTLTFKSKGLSGNDAIYRARLLDGGTGGAVTPGTRTALSGGTTEPSVVNALTLITQREYRLIVACIGNTDAANASTTSTLGRLKTHLVGRGEGIGALLQTVHSACTDSLVNAKACTNQHNFEFFTHHLARGALSLPCEWAGAVAGLVAREIRTDPNHNFIHTPFRAELYGSPSIDADALTAAECEDALVSGVSYVSYTVRMEPRLERPITSYFEDSDGNPDDRVLDASKPLAAMAVLTDLRTRCARAWANMKLAKTLPAGSTPIPPRVVTEAAARAFIVGILREWCGQGVILESELDAALADGSLVIQVDDTDEHQLDTYLPLKIVPIFAKHSIVLHQR